jgi:BirA family transcriptional regulator, biotin operon repressor / biotin---[acetyl-CoA-carboxylase] ligase
MEKNDISPEAVLNGLNTRFIGQKIICYPSLNSTNEAAKKEAIWGAPAGTVIIANEQTAGRGRLQRTWVSPKGGLALSVILRPNFDYLPYIVMLTSLAVAFSIQALTGLKPQIKWPNDVLIKERKVCGILIENGIRKNSLQYTVIGIGINVNIRISDYPEIASFATSLSDQIGKEVSRLHLTRFLLEQMEKLYQTLAHSDYVLEEWKKNLVTLGQKVRANLGEKVYTGTAESVTRDGSLMLRLRDGKLVKIMVGDVSLR